MKITSSENCSQSLVKVSDTDMTASTLPVIQLHKVVVKPIHMLLFQNFSHDTSEPNFSLVGTNVTNVTLLIVRSFTLISSYIP